MDTLHTSEKSEQNPSPLVPTEYPPSRDPPEAGSDDPGGDDGSTGWQLEIQDAGQTSSQIIVNIAPITKVTNLAHCQNQLFYAPSNSQLESTGAMPYIDCNATASEIDAMLAQVQTYGISCAVVYSSTLAGCAAGPRQDWLRQMIPNLFTMVTSSSAMQLLQILRNPSPNVVTASISGSDSKFQTPQKGNSKALIALYVTTSVVLATLLAILVCAFIRVRRHPERYNHRNSDYAMRAKGLAKAVLDSIPLVQVSKNPQNSDEEEQKSNSGEERNTLAQSGEQHILDDPSKAATSEDCTTLPQLAQSEIDGVSRPRSSGTPRSIELTGKAAIHHANPNKGSRTKPLKILITDNEDICPICFEEYEEGELLRLLPCKHKFHASCIDPWLLEASSECPLCRCDLGQLAEAGKGEDPSSGHGYTFLYRAKQWTSRLNHPHLPHLPLHHSSTSQSRLPRET